MLEDLVKTVRTGHSYLRPDFQVVFLDNIRKPIGRPYSVGILAVHSLASSTYA
jgi:hypothetical protein